jgi:hypothetical protein
MAADFGSEVTQVNDVPNTVSPQEGVVDKSASVLLAGVGDVFEAAGGILEGRRESRQAGIIADFASRQLLIADALEQGAITSSVQARALARKNLLEAIAANPSLARDLIAADGSLTSLPGGTGVISEDTEEEQRISAERDRLVSEGLVSATASDTEFETAAEQRRVAAEASRRYNERIQTIDLALRTNNLAQSERDRLESERVAETSRYVRDMVPAEQTRVKTQFDAILADSTLSEADKQIAIEDFYNQWLGEVAGTLGDVSSQQATYLLKPFEALRDSYLARATGEIGDAELKRQNERAVALQQALILADPDLAAVAATTELFGNSAIIDTFISGNPTTRNKLLQLLAGNNPNEPSVEGSTTFTALPAEREAVKGYLNGITTALASPDAEVKAQATEQLTAVLTSLEDYEGLIRSDPKKAIEVVNWLSSASFIRARNANPELFEDIGGAVDVLTRHYSDEVWGLVEREFIANDIISVNNFGREGVYNPLTGARELQGEAISSVPTTSRIGVRSTASGMEFYSLSPEPDADTRDKVFALNRDLKPVINTTVKAFAHLEGRTDYGAMFEEVAGEMLGPEAVVDTDAEDDLSLDDFVLPKVSSTSLPVEVASDTAFVERVNSLASSLEIAPSVLMAVMDFETGGSFNPAQRNAAGSSATGLIQFMAETAEGLGTSTETLAGMSRLEQMDYVEKYFNQYADQIRGGDARDVYMAVLFPRAIGKSDDYVLFSQGTTAYTQNKGLDRNGDGVVTKAEASRSVVGLVGKYEDS